MAGSLCCYKPENQFPIPSGNARKLSVMNELSMISALQPKTLYKKTVQENVDDDRLTNRIFPGPTQ
jgi:hypothetical protein